MASSDDLVNAKIEAAEARTDTKIVRLEGKLDLVLNEIRNSNQRFTEIKTDISDSRRATIANIWVVFAAMVALIVGMAAFAPVVFDLGSKFRETITKEVQEQAQRAAPAKEP